MKPTNKNKRVSGSGPRARSQNEIKDESGKVVLSRFNRVAAMQQANSKYTTK